MSWLRNFSDYVENTVTSVTSVTPAPLLGFPCNAGSEACVTSVTPPAAKVDSVTHVTQPPEAPLHGKPAPMLDVTGVTDVTQENTPPCWDYDPVLEALCDDLDPEDAQALRDERAGILEYQAGFNREDSEAVSGLLDRRTA